MQLIREDYLKLLRPYPLQSGRLHKGLHQVGRLSAQVQL